MSILAIDYLAGALYPKVVMQSLRPGWAAGFFAREFGDAFPLVQKVSNSGKVPVIRMQLTWAGSSHNYTTKHLKEAIKEAKRYEKLKGHSAVELSSFCEHTLKNPDPWLDEIKAAAPSCTIVNNPWSGRGALSKRYKNEIHSGLPPKKGPYNYSYDGAAAVDADIEGDKAKYKDAAIFFLWTWQLNCHYNHEDRTRTTRPTVQLIESLYNLENARGDVGLPNNYLWKSHAEQSDPKGDWRSNKCLLIAPGNESKFELVRGDTVLAVANKYPVDFEDGRRRYYFGKWGYELSTQPVKLRGGSGKVYGTVNPGFRGRPYR